ncbi:DUF4437 domain-containing protein [Sphingosinicella sp. LHD-64]|uniref:DUF4437 domain-containing protein n=1 Tax=Sphingosinicella sp. LHD-64 TaxID=3072139 RepID=UPI00280F3D93|nr:DUF4437 domain-containing protein [Sphingosinicella sp. LHD-64]MDQ8756989.1 DUF4437 domain-containing protein [Sphingosinicella sp. LHD-64]
MLGSLLATAIVTVPIEDARFAPVDPARPDGARMAVLRGDPATGPSDMLLLMPRGEGALHVHSADYRLVMLRGTLRRWGVGGREGAADLGPGSYSFQPGGVAHGSECLTDECLMFVSWSGRRDGRLATEADSAE